MLSSDKLNSKARSILFSQTTLFYLVLLINAILISTVRFYPSMDGPSHLYNSNLLVELLKGNSSETHQFFGINPFPVSNWTSMFILSLFNWFLPAWLAEKILILTYLIGMCLSFRFLVRQVNPGGMAWSFLIFPFVYTFLFHLGFYNYSLSFVFYFLIVGYWVKYQDRTSFRKYLIAFLLLSGLYFSALITFVFAGLSLGIYSLSIYLSGTKSKKTLFIELGLLFLISAPYLFLSLYFIKTSNFYPSGQEYSVNELVKWINDVRCLIIYDYPGDEKLTQQVLHLIIAFLSISIYIRFAKIEKPFLQTSDALLMAPITALLLLFLIPNSSGAGMMSDRFCQLFYLSFIVWIAAQKLPLKLSYVFVILILAFHFGLLFKHHNGVIRDLNRNAMHIEKAAEHIHENAIVLPVNLSDSWIEPHFSNYLGIDKPMIILENYEASVGWFPLQWKLNDMPIVQFAENQSIDGLNWPSGKNLKNKKEIDFIFFYGNLSKLETDEWKNRISTIYQQFNKVYSPDNKYVLLLKRKHWPDK